MKRVVSRLALVALLAVIAGLAWWLTHREGVAPEVGDLETADDPADATNPPSLASLEGNADAAASRRTRLPRGEGAIVGTVLRDGAPVAARIAIHVTHVGPGFNPWGRGTAGMWARAFALPPTPDAASGSVRAGEDGRFTIADLGAGAFTLFAETTDGATGATLALVPVEGARVEVSIPVAGGGESLHGRVVWADGRPFAGTLRVVPQSTGGRSQFPSVLEGRAVAADADGRFLAAGLAPGPVAVTAYVEERLIVTGAAVTLPHAGDYLLTLDAGLVQVVGRVVRHGDDTPVAGASVTAQYGRPSQQSVMSRAVTDADGRFDVTATLGREGRLYVQATGFASTAVPAPPPPPPAASAEPFVIRMTPGATLNGRVTRDSDDAPVPGMTVSAIAMGSVWLMPDPATTDVDGRYMLVGVAAGESMVVASGQGYVTKGAEQASRDGYNPLVVTLTDGAGTTVDLLVTAGARIEGRVLDAAGTPVVGAVVQTRPRSDGLGQIGAAPPAASDKEGHFALDGNMPGLACFLSAESPGFSTATAGPVTPVAGTTTTLEIRFADARFVDVTVLDAAAGTPVAGARLVPWGLSGNPFGLGQSTFASASDGRARVGPLPAGEQQIGVEAHDYAGVVLTVAESDTSRVVRLNAGHEVSGLVTYPDGAPAPGVSVMAWIDSGPSPSVSTDADGKFLLRSVPAGKVTLRAHTFRDGTALGAITQVEEGARGVVLRLIGRDGQESGRRRLVARVFDPQGRPVPLAHAVLRTKSSTSGRSVNDGRVEWTQAIPAGSEAVVEVWGARDASGAFLPLGRGTATVPDGAMEVELRLAPEVTVSGTVRAADGAPVRGVLIRVQPAVTKEGRGTRGRVGDPWHRNAPQARTDDAGVFRLGGLAAEEYDLTVVAPPTYAPAKSLRVRGGDRDVDVRLKAGLTVAVTVRDADGKPVSGVGVSGRSQQTEDTSQPGGRSGGDGGATTGVDGVARLSGLDADVVYTLEVSGKGEDLGSVTIDPWKPRDETVTLPRVWVVAGVVRDQAGRPVTNAHVMRKMSEGAWAGTDSDEQGRFRMTGLPEGDVVLRAMVPGLPFDHNDTTGEVRVPAGTKGVVIALDLGLDLVVRVENLSDLGPNTPGAFLVVRRGGQTVHLLPQDAPTTGYRFRGLALGDVGTFWIPVQGVEGTHSVYAPGLRPGADVRVRAMPGRSIIVRMQVPAGADNVNVSATLDGHGVGGEARPDGSYEIRGIPPGTTWTVKGHARSSGGSIWLTGEATAVAGATVEIELKPQESSQGK
jgi:hypothetical protein